MKTFKKINRQITIKLSNNISITMPEHGDNDEELMVGIGMLVQLFVLNREEYDKDYDPERMKQMLCGYIDAITERMKDGKK